MDNITIAAVLHKIAYILDPSGDSSQVARNMSTVDFNMFKQPPKPGEKIAIWDPRHPEYTPDRAWQVMLRRYARDAGLSDSNAFVKDRFKTGDGKAPIWPDEKQDWEP